MFHIFLFYIYPTYIVENNTKFSGEIDNIEMNVKKKEGPNMKLIKTS